MNKLINIEKTIVEVPKYNELEASFHEALNVVDDIVLKNYLTQLHELEVIPLNQEVMDSNIAENVRFFKITEMVYEKDEYSTYKFASVFNALSNSNCAVFIIIDSNGIKTDFYMGIRSLNSDRTTNSLKEILRNSMAGQFPGIRTKDYLDEEMNVVLSRMKTNNITSVSSVANSKDGDNKLNKNFIQGLEKLTLSMQGEKYTAVILADGTPLKQISETRKNYENIFTQLSPFMNSQISFANSSSVTMNETETKGTSIGTSISENKSSTVGKTNTFGESQSESISKESFGSKSVKGIAAASSLLGAALAPVTGGASLVVGGVVAGGFGLLGTAIQQTESKGTVRNSSQSLNESETNGSSFGTTESRNESISNSKGLQSGTTNNLTFTQHNKSIINILDRIDMQLSRLQEFESLGMWECAAYFMSDNPYTAEIAASTYKALMRGENSGVEVSAINSWSEFDENKTDLIRQYITNFIHPVFSYESPAGLIPVTPCSLVSGNELALHMGLPRRSVCGFPVIEHADFGKEVVSYSEQEHSQILNLGNIFNMGMEMSSRVKLNRASLTMHTFVTGSTGSGKSNTIYEMLRQLNAVDIKFMVIEPAKGEYKNIFGNHPDVTVLGTNPNQAELLRINPFKFPCNIHILEHVDRLIEIFNVCWPMYAAMPAVLKDAVLQAYEVSGWDLTTSKNRYSEELFPTFEDLQSELVKVIENSAYSQELKGNYIGSLATRIKSLTNGLNGEIFSSNETDNKLLFDQNVIVDLSRVGSLETKSLIMGVLVMRLNEYRMSNSDGMNIPLKHVTVLEEAHNILKKTTGQSVEGGNVSDKSVEMLSNAIAEMRTYGEGFIIVDQSPSAVDSSAIKNTNTKIILRLPDEQDRRLVGKAAGLSDEQLDEIAKLPRGVAAIYQNDWIEPILCKVKKYSGEEKTYKHNVVANYYVESEKRFKSELVNLLLNGRIQNKVDVDIDLITKYVNVVKMSTKNKIGVMHLVDEFERNSELSVWNDNKFEELSTMITEMLNAYSIIDSFVSNEKEFDSLTFRMMHYIEEQIPDLRSDFKISICQCFMKYFSCKEERNVEIYSAWRKSVTEGGVSDEFFL